MNDYIPEEYLSAIKMLEPIVEKYKLDPILVSSIVRGAIEIESQPIQPAKVVWKTKNDNTYSIKASNIKVNLSFALSNAFRLKTIFNSEDIWLVLAIIHLAVDLFTSAKQKIDEISALVLLATFRLQKATKEEIMEYAMQIKPGNSNLIVNDEKVNEALEILENLKCIELRDGKYHVIETIDSSLFLS